MEFEPLHIDGAFVVMAGGLLTDAFGWSSVFLVTVPVSAAAVVLARRVLEDCAGGTHRWFDWVGAGAVTAAVVTLVNGALAGAEQGWGSTPAIASTRPTAPRPRPRP